MEFEVLLRTYLVDQSQKRLFREGEIDELANRFRKSMVDLGLDVTQEKFETSLRNVKTILEIIVEGPTGEKLVDSKHKQNCDWIGDRSEESYFFWNRYKKYLCAQKGWNSRTMIEPLDRVSHEILDLCGNPAQVDPFAVRGLVLGDIQSGKTANYTAICNKAADLGYRYIIVLTGVTEDLRRQTQERLDLEFVGMDSRRDRNLQDGGYRLYGVSQYGVGKQIASYTSSNSDFEAGNCEQTGVLNQNPVLMVVKKNSSRLKSLYKWLNNNPGSHCADIEYPLLLIDDEADNASINVSDTEDPTAINRWIRKILKKFKKSTYLAVTATPYANIFIDPSPENADLFPSDFIYKLNPPSNYIGPKMIFSDDPDYKWVEFIDQSEDNHPIPLSTYRCSGIGVLPNDLIEAINYFVLLNAILKVKEPILKNVSMLVHVSMKNVIQRSIFDLIRNYFDSLKADLKNYARRPDCDSIESICNIHRVWDKFNLAEYSSKKWNDVLPALNQACENIQIQCINSEEEARLNYRSNDENGLSVIAVGGNCLSRGLTLEGLCVSYFCRNAQTYDTLLQMGRWFGYRDNYAQYCKIWMPELIFDNFARVMRATEELKRDIEEMVEAGKTPSEFRLKVRHNPGALMVTALKKMRNTEIVRMPISLIGSLVETPKLCFPRKIDNDKFVDANDDVMRDFIKNLDKYGTRVANSDDRADGNYLWKHVDMKKICDLISKFNAHMMSLQYRTDVLVDYINNNHFDDWDVVIRSLKKTDEANLLTFESGETLYVTPENRTIEVYSNDCGGVIAISGAKGRVGSGDDTKIGLTKAQIEQIREEYAARDKTKKLSDKAFLSIERSPILFIHAIKPKPDSIVVHASSSMTKEQVMGVDCFFALGIGFACSSGRTAAEEYALYVINNRVREDEQDEIE